MFTISKRFSFSAHHRLDAFRTPEWPDDDPRQHPCSRDHGHNYIVEVDLAAPILSPVGFVVDYRAAATRLQQAGAYAADLDAVDRLASQGSLSLTAFALLQRRHDAAFRGDGTIDVDELRHGMELVHDIAVGQGDVDVNRYPDME